MNAFDLVRIFSAINILIQTIEYLHLFHKKNVTAIWNWNELRKEFSWLKLFDVFLNDNNIKILLLIRFISAFCMLYQFNVVHAFIALFTTLLIAARFRGSFNGGSDYMTAIVTAVLFIVSFHPTIAMKNAGLWYIALQSALSYLSAGLVKLKQASWRDGSALKNFIHSPNYNPPRRIKKMLSHSVIAKCLSWMVMGLEVFFPLVLFQSKTIALTGLAFVFGFHFINVFLFGLNRFLFAWLATYPAIYFVANSFSNSP